MSRFWSCPTSRATRTHASVTRRCSRAIHCPTASITARGRPRRSSPSFTEAVVPAWIDVSVVAEDGKRTLVQIRCCGLFTALDDLLYHRHPGGVPPFSVKSPVLPPGWSTGETSGRFDSYWRRTLTDRGSANEPSPRKTVLGLCILLGSTALAVVGAFMPPPSDLNLVTGSIYGFVLGAIVGVVIDRVRGRF